VSDLLVQKFIVGLLFNNVYLVSDAESKRALVIDPTFGSAEKILPAAADLGLKIELILNTHGHFDHVGGNAALKAATGARILISEADAQMLTVPFPPTDQEFPFEPSTADGFLSDGQVVELGGLRLSVMHTPGHTPGSVCLYSAAEAIVFTGDTLLEGAHGRSDFPGGNAMLLKESLKKIAGLPAATRVAGGHGIETTLESEMDWLSDLF
jgi:glyoxylase-like metal-dependent hydrolase (beta-lactamase superfamily II)